MAGWQFWIDRGGTFTGIAARAPSGSIAVERLDGCIETPGRDGYGSL